MLHACFQLLTDCIEKEKLLTGNTDWNYSRDFKKVRTEIQTLHKWWRGRKERSSKKNFNDLDPKQYEEDNAMLIRLIKVRAYLWT